MDVILEKADELFFTPHVYPKDWAEDDITRQSLSLFLITLVGGYLLYLTGAWFCYEFLFEKALLKHPKILENQIQKELASACFAIPFMTGLQVPFFLAEIRGYTKLYDNLDEYPLGYTLWTLFCFMMWNDFAIYWIHRFLHHRSIYKYIHKEHHRWLVPTPFASHAFHPIDGFMQGLPYGLFIFMMPLNKWVHLLAFIAVNYWTINIHIGPPYATTIVPDLLKNIINGPAHHTDHHLYYNVNYGQYFIFWDWIGGSLKFPTCFEGKGPDMDLVPKKVN